MSAPPRSGTASANCARRAPSLTSTASLASQPFTGQQRCVCVVMPLLSMYINNKAGGLIYQRVRTCHTSRNRRPPSDFMPHPALAQDFGSNAGATTSNKEVNDHLLLASTFNSLAMILKELSPVPRSSKLELLEAETFVLQSFDTATGLKFFLTADPESKHLDQVLKEVYVLYSDFVLKNPFYELDMPIHCDKFDQKLMKLAEDYNRRG